LDELQLLLSKASSGSVLPELVASTVDRLERGLWKVERDLRAVQNCGVLYCKEYLKSAYGV
jgi:hypothetical protein